MLKLCYRLKLSLLAIMFRGPKNYLQTVNRIRTFASERLATQPAAAAPVSKGQLEVNQLNAEKFKIGQTYHGFVCERVSYVPDFNMTAYMFEHQRLKSQYLHLDRNDPNNVFSINFRTTPFDSTGIPHILEHSVLCGSEKFPVRDPFFKMLNRSMATFMNAMTGPDYTLYPFSSMNERDFRNLQTIYLDAVFKPNLNYLDFLQEGWRLENSNLNDIQSEHTIKGVVYNEMKGSFSENSNIFSTKFMNQILPSHTYGHCSGGDPLAIPDLTHEALVAFHKKYYHPCNARFFSYGNFPLQHSLKYIDDQYLRKFEQIATEFSQIPKETRWTTPKSEHILSRFDNMGAPIEQQNQIAIGFLLSDITDNYETLLLNVLTELMVKGPNSPFYQNLIEPNFSGGYSPMTGFESSIRDTMFVVGLQDVRKEDFKKVETIVDETIDQIVANGFDADHVNSVLNNIELSLKHQSPKFGLGLLFNITPIWNHNGDIVETVQFGQIIAKLRKNLENKSYLQDRVRYYFKDTKHRLVMTMSPDDQYEAKFSAAEKELIEKKSKSLTKEQREKIFQNGKDLAENQKSPQDLNLLPCLSLSDVKTPPANAYTLKNKTIGSINTQICTVDTNNVSYFNSVFSANCLSNEQKLLLPLLANIIDQMGTNRRDFRAFDKYVTANTSGIHIGLHFSDDATDLTRYNIGLSLGSYCLEQNIPVMFEILNEILTEFNFKDVSRFEMLLKNYSSALSVGIAGSGHIYAMQSASGLVNESAALKTKLTGIEHIDFIRKLIESTPPAEILQQLTEVANTIFRHSGLKCALNTSAGISDKFVRDYSKFIQQTATNKAQLKTTNSLISNVLPASNQHTVMNIPVNYCAKSVQTVPFTHSDFPALRVLGKVLSSKYLLPVVREQNGAYGAGAKIARDGLFNFFSYRDPNSQKTLDTFDASASWIRENWAKIDEQLLFEAKLGVLQQLDEPTAPGSKGMDLFKAGIDDEMFNAHRRQVLAVSKDDLEFVTQRYLADGAVKSVGRFVLGPENKGFCESSDWTVKQQQS